jgi:hypothetical protein
MMNFRLTRRARLLCALGSLALIFTAAVLWLLVFSGPEGYEESFRVDFVREMRQGATNIVVFRLIAPDSKRIYSVLTPGEISVPNGFAPLIVFPSASPSPVYGPWTLLSLPAARWATNFVPLTFKRQVEFAILAPTNEVWRLNLHVSRVLTPIQVFGWKTQRAWNFIKGRKFSAVPGAWSGPWSVTLSSLTWSAPLTNKPTLDGAGAYLHSSLKTALHGK